MQTTRPAPPAPRRLCEDTRYGTNVDEQADQRPPDRRVQEPRQPDLAHQHRRAGVRNLVGRLPTGWLQPRHVLVAKDPETLEYQYQRPYAYEEDDLTNIELGWKTTFWGGRAQFNGAIYQVTWENAQTGFFAPQLGFGNLQFFTNGPDYEVNGIEFDVAVAPIDGLTVNLAGSYNQGELTNSPQLINNIPGSPSFGQPITESCVDSL